MVAVFEEKMDLYRNQLVELESHLSAVGRDHSVSPQSGSLYLLSPSPVWVCGVRCSLFSDLVDILQVQYKPFLLLAAQLQTIHEQVQVQAFTCEPINFSSLLKHNVKGCIPS